MVASLQSLGASSKSCQKTNTSWLKVVNLDLLTSGCFSLALSLPFNTHTEGSPYLALKCNHLQGGTQCHLTAINNTMIIKVSLGQEVAEHHSQLYLQEEFMEMECRYPTRNSASIHPILAKSVKRSSSTTNSQELKMDRHNPFASFSVSQLSMNRSGSMQV